MNIFEQEFGDEPSPETLEQKALRKKAEEAYRNPIHGDYEAPVIEELPNGQIRAS